MSNWAKETTCSMADLTCTLHPLGSAIVGALSFAGVSLAVRWEAKSWRSADCSAIEPGRRACDRLMLCPEDNGKPTQSRGLFSWIKKSATSTTRNGRKKLPDRNSASAVRNVAECS